MTELGDIQYDENKKFGVSISKVCDEVILVGKSKLNQSRWIKRS